MSTTSPLGVTTDTDAKPDTKGFDIRAFAAGTGVITKSVDVCGKPHLIGQIEELKAYLERPKPEPVADERASGPATQDDPDLAVAEQLEQLRAEVMESIVTFKLRGLRNGEREKILAACKDKKQVENKDEGLEDELSEFNYRRIARQIVSIGGRPAKLDWEDVRLLHVGRGDEGDDEFVSGLGAHFMQTIYRTAAAALNGVGVDVPFSLRSSSLTSRE